MSTPPDVAPSSVTVAEHLEQVLAVARTLPALPVSLADAQGCLLAEDVVSDLPMPGFDTATADGYAVRAADVAGVGVEGRTASLVVVGDVEPGVSAGPLAVQPGCAVRVTAGAALPPGTDLVVPQPWTDGGLARVEVRFAPKPGSWVRARGSELALGATVLGDGVRIGPPELGALAAAGRDQVLVRPRPRVVVVATGRGLVEAGGTVGPGQEIDSGSHLLAAAVRDAGGTAYRVGVLPDDPRRLLDALEDHLIRADLVLATGVTGGAPGGDVVASVLKQIGVVSTVRVALHPGGIFSVGTIGPDQVPYIGLPGHPVAALVGFHLFVAPFLRAQRGLESGSGPAVVEVVTGSGFASPAGLRHLVPARLDPKTGVASLVGEAGVHPVVACGRADVLLDIAEDVTAVAAGTPVSAVPLASA